MRCGRGRHRLRHQVRIGRGDRDRRRRCDVFARPVRLAHRASPVRQHGDNAGAVEMGRQHDRQAAAISGPGGKRPRVHQRAQQDVVAVADDAVGAEHHLVGPAGHVRCGRAGVGDRPADGHRTAAAPGCRGRQARGNQVRVVCDGRGDGDLLTVVIGCRFGNDGGAVRVAVGRHHHLQHAGTALAARQRHRDAAIDRAAHRQARRAWRHRHDDVDNLSACRIVDGHQVRPGAGCAGRAGIAVGPIQGDLAAGAGRGRRVEPQARDAQVRRGRDVELGQVVGLPGSGGICLEHGIAGVDGHHEAVGAARIHASRPHDLHAALYGTTGRQRRCVRLHHGGHRNLVVCGQVADDQLVRPARRGRRIAGVGRRPRDRHRLPRREPAGGRRHDRARHQVGIGGQRGRHGQRRRVVALGRAGRVALGDGVVHVGGHADHQVAGTLATRRQDQADRPGERARGGQAGPVRHDPALRHDGARGDVADHDAVRPGA